MFIELINTMTKMFIDSIREREIKLVEEIKKLNHLIHVAEFTLSHTTFKNIQTVTTNSNQPNPKAKVHDGEMQINHELYQYSGIYCVAFEAHRYEFEFKTGCKYDDVKTYSVQILIVDGKKTLGKCILPISIDIDELIETTPLSDPRNISVLLKKCRHQILCHTMRLEQFHSLKVNVYPIGKSNNL